MFMEERKNTGRVYLMNVDHANSHGSFKPEFAPIKQSNLCCEINLPTNLCIVLEIKKVKLVYVL